MSLETVKNTQNIPFVYSPKSFDEAFKFATMIANSNFAPKDYRGKPEDTFIAIQMGAEVGIAALQSLQSISVINGRPSIWGDMAIALVRSSEDCVSIEEWADGDIKSLTRVAYCKAKNKSGDTVIRSFSIADAQRAALWNKGGPWQQYPDRMLQMRARGFTLRDLFPHVLKGLALREEAIDLPKEHYSVISVEEKNKSPGVIGLQARLSATEKTDEEHEEEVISMPETELEDPIKLGISLQDLCISLQDIESIINDATDMNDLDVAADCARQLPESDKIKVRELYKNKLAELKAKEVDNE